MINREKLLTMIPNDAGTGAALPTRVLIADREERVRSALRLLLHDRCPLVVAGEAEDTNEALDMVQAWAPDVVLLGWNLARLRGPKFIRQLRAAQPEVVILVLGTTRDAQERALRWGADGFINQGQPPESWVPTLRGHCVDVMV